MTSSGLEEPWQRTYNAEYWKRYALFPAVRAKFDMSIAGRAFISPEKYPLNHEPEIIIPIMICLVGAFILFSGCTRPIVCPLNATPAPACIPKPPSSGDLASCTKDSECVPARCCHPESCINALCQPDCSGIACTAVCQGPIDCGAGHCGCVDGKCQVIAGPKPVPAG